MIIDYSKFMILITLYVILTIVSSPDTTKSFNIECDTSETWADVQKKIKQKANDNPNHGTIVRMNVQNAEGQGLSSLTTRDNSKTLETLKIQDQYKLSGGLLLV